jgi:DNA-binding NtrC family response regulator
MKTQKSLPLICIVDDERSIGRALMRLFRQLDASVEAFVDPLEALAWLKDNPVDVLISDQRMPGMSGTELVAAVADCQPDCTRFILSGYSDFDEITAAFNSGLIQKYISKPWNDKELLFAIEKVLRQVPVTTDASGTTEREPTGEVVGTMIGADPCMIRLFDQVRRMSTANVPVYIHGETGTGKELVARALHAESFRAGKPFVAVNCANFSPELMESQLFGHRKGAFTGANSDHSGLLETANGGTLFLDEVTTLPLALQSKLLRVLQEREYSPVGSMEVISFDAQVLSASSTRLSDAVAAGDFREDLRYRLEVLPLDVPPLRERGRDSLVLFDHYLMEVRQDVRFEFTRQFEQFLASYAWPGNVRQLINLAGYVATMAELPELDLDSLPAEVRESYLKGAGASQSIESVAHDLQRGEGGEDGLSIQPLRDLEREAIERALILCDNNIQQAAAQLEISASTVYRKMQVWSDQAS